MPPTRPFHPPIPAPRVTAGRPGTVRRRRVVHTLAWLRERLTEAALHRFDVALAVRMAADALETAGPDPSRITLAEPSLHPSLAASHVAVSPAVAPVSPQTSRRS